MHCCKICNYKTKDRSNYSRHQKSKKHLKKIQANLIPSDKPPINDKNLNTSHKPVPINDKSISTHRSIEHICSHCGGRYTRYDNLKRHEGKCVAKRLQDKDNALRHKNKENEILKQRLEETTKQKDEYHNYYKQLLEISNNRLNTDNISAFNYIISHYNEADPLKEITYKEYKKARDMTYIKNKPHDEQIIEDIFIAHKNKRLHKMLGDIIIKLYRTDDPKKQSLWSTDGSRNKYVVRKQNKALCQWVADNKGSYTMNRVVSPLIEHIKDMISQWVDKHCRENEEDLYLEFECSSDEDCNSSESEENPFAKDLKRDKYVTKVNEYIGILTDLKNDIEKKWVQRKTLKYISPYFSVNKTSIKDDK